MKISEGWKLVPVEPTEKMIEAAETVDVHPYRDTKSYQQLVFEAMLAAAPTPPAQDGPLVGCNDGFGTRIVQEVPLRKQPEVTVTTAHGAWNSGRGTRKELEEDAKKLREQVERQVAILSGVAQPAQEDKPVAWMDVHDNWDLYKNKPSQVDVIPLYTRPDNSGLRKAAGEALRLLDFWRPDYKGVINPDETEIIENLRKALENK